MALHKGFLVVLFFVSFFFLSSPEPKAHGELIG